MYVTGMSYSSDFPLTPGTFDCVNTRGDGFVVKINALGDSLIYSTFLGGNNFDQGISIALDGSGDSYVGGHTWSTDFPVTPGGFDTTPNPPDSFIARINAEGTSVLNATYLGGSNGDDVVYGVAIGPSGNLYATGNTLSTDFPVTPGAFDTTPNGYYDAIAVRLNMSAGSENQPPMILTFSATPAKEGSAAILTVDARDSDGDALTYDFDFESDGVFDVSGPSSTATHIYGDDFNGTATMRVSDGNLSTEATTPVIVLNVPPTIDGVITATATFDVTLRVAGEKWHDVTATVYLNGAEYATASVVRMSGSPNDQAVTIANVTLDLASSDTWSARVVYTPPDDPVNGQMNGANPAWLVFTAKDGSESRLHHTFNVRHNDTWVWEVPDLRAMLVGFPIEFAATATDQGSDDLTFTWDWGDGSPATATIYYNDGIGPDPYPSPGGTFPFAATDSEAHAYQAAGMYELKLIVRDDDGGTTEIPLVVVIV
jgi:hypothetical protein